MSGKALLRTQALQILLTLDRRRREEAAVAAFVFLVETLQDRSKMIGSFSPKPLELNLRPWNRFLMQRRKLALPRRENDSLTFYEVTSSEMLLSGDFGLQEPDPALCKKVYPEEMDLVIVPGLCFDKTFHRIGYGKGYFDRFLSENPDLATLGIGFSEQYVPKIPEESFDIALKDIRLF